MFHRPLARATISHARLAARSVPVAGPSRILPLCRRWNSSTHSPADPNAPAIEAPVPGAKSQPIGQLEPRLSMTFTCTAGECGHRSTHEFSKRAYTRGIVLVQCPSCKNRHLIADHIGWFKESTEEGTLRTVEDLLRARGEAIQKGRVNFDGDIEYEP
ncbi:DNL zinc finger-domain-containing protein [Papiliotrema laurentii]|uniref:DNL zinc finger-domain-containing protein n=1 Tax=Papiliotrema laurentii TaxID=5418 RepID=A0AAD9L8J8_PAPLA|nr:DNL zinc finger-domain-containing protein [Papiliotrema laurentii]